MRPLLFLFISVLLIHADCNAQNWAPFNFNKKILYGTPDSIGGLLVGQSLALVRFDTSITSGSETTMFCKNGLGPDESLASLGKAKSMISLYGRKMKKQGNQYWFYPHRAEPDSLLYNADAKPGDLAIEWNSYGYWRGIVQQKTVTTINGILDSVKVILITDFWDPGPGAQYYYTAIVSKTHGFLKMPAFFFNYAEKQPEYSYFGDYDKNIKGIKSFSSQINRFEAGDILITKYYSDYRSGMAFVFQSNDTIKTRVLSVSGDSCLVLDSTKRVNLLTNTVSYTTGTRKMVNKPYIYYVDTSGTLISSQVNYSVRAAFMSKDSCMFLGYMQCALGLADYDGSNLLSTQFPILFKNDFNLFSNSTQLVPLYFKRGNTTFGQPVHITFTSMAESLSSKLSIFPNPAINSLNILGLPPGPSSLSLFNIQGKAVLEKQVDSESKLEIGFLPKGLYHVCIKSGKQVYSAKVLKN